MWYLILCYLALAQATTTRSNSSDLLNTTTVLDVRTPPKVQLRIEASHAGVAIPMDDEVMVEPTTKTSLYKPRPTTTATNGLSTWILLSGQSTSTTTKKPSIKPKNQTLSDHPLKPLFKQRTTTSTSTSTSKPASTTLLPTKKPTKLTKVKASLLTSTTTSTEAPLNVTTMLVESKEGDQDLPTTKKPKKKKNKNKRKHSKEGNDKLKEIETGATQLYSYLRSEIIPVTVGVSLVGLLVTAGLASYYLQPFAALRRNDPIDRKDTGGYYYQDQYSNSMPEEEAIGKVIAGMPETIYTKPVQKNTYPQYRKVERRSQVYMNPFGTVEDVKLHEEPKFVVGNVPTQEPTPAVVPEHGPRTYSGASPRLIRQRREVDSENEIDSDIVETTTGVIMEETTQHNVFKPNERPNSFLELIADLFKMKLKLGMEVLQNVTNSVTSYANQVRTRLDEHYRGRNSTKH